MKRLMKPLALGLVCLLLLTSAATAFADSGTDPIGSERTPRGEGTVSLDTHQKSSKDQGGQRPPMDGIPGDKGGAPTDGQGGQRPPMDGIPGDKGGAPTDGQGGQRPPMDGIPGDKGGAPMDGQGGQRPPMDGIPENEDAQHGGFGPMGENDPMRAVLAGVDGLEDGETKTALKALLDAYRDAIDAERKADKDGKEAAAKAVAAARDAVNAALAEAKIDARIAAPGEDERPPMLFFEGAQDGKTPPEKPADDGKTPPEKPTDDGKTAPEKSDDDGSEL